MEAVLGTQSGFSQQPELATRVIVNVAFRLTGSTSEKVTAAFRSPPRYRLRLPDWPSTLNDPQTRQSHTSRSQNALQRDRNKRCECVLGKRPCRAARVLIWWKAAEWLVSFVVRFQAACNSTCWPPGATLTLCSSSSLERKHNLTAFVLWTKWIHIQNRTQEKGGRK